MDTKELFEKLKKEAKLFSIHEISKARASMDRGVKDLPQKYRQMYSSRLFEYLYDTLNEIKNRKGIDHAEEVQTDRYNEIVRRINGFVDDDQTQKAFAKLAKITTLYLVFIKKSPIHPTGMIFPGGLKINERDGRFYCPVKDKQSEVDIALCEFCICRDIEEMENR